MRWEVINKNGKWIMDNGMKLENDWDKMIK